MLSTWRASSGGWRRPTSCGSRSEGVRPLQSYSLPGGEMSEAIFRGYDRQALDREYNNRGKVASFADYLARYPRESEATRRALAPRLDVPYGPTPAETLDIFPAAGPGPAPVNVFIHGGYWMAFDKKDFSFVARAFHPAGAATVVINYALIP